MKTISVKRNQTLFDVALEQYGTLEAVGEILRNNPGLTNDVGALAELGIDAVNSSDFYPDVMLEAGQAIAIDTDSETIRGSIVKQLEQDITTFDL